MKRFEYLRVDKEDKFDVVPLAKVASIVQKELVLIETNELGNFRLEYKKDMPSY